MSSAKVVARTDGKPLWIQYLHQRVSKNKNFVGFIEGPTGSGKSYSGIEICRLADPKFNADQIVFNARELMDLINKKDLPSGSAILFEEVGVELDSAKWQNLPNTMIKYFLETFRHRRWILLMTAPYSDYVAKGTRKLIHATFETQGIDFKRKTCILKPLMLQYNSKNGKTYYKYLKVITKRGKIPLKRWHVRKPPEKLLKDYEKRKREFTDALNRRIYKELTSAEKESKITYPHKCEKCAHKWEARIPTPARCTKCQSNKIYPDTEGPKT